MGVNTMKKSKKRKAIGIVTCPYCGSKAKLVNGLDFLGDRAHYDRYFVCSHYPHCDSYVAVHDGTTTPMGPLANKQLRRLRYEAHESFNRLWVEGYMTKDDAYAWLAVKLKIPFSAAHIGQMGEYRCRQIIEMSKENIAQLVSARKGA